MASRVKETTFGARETLKITTAQGVTPLKEIPDGKEFQYYGHVISEVTNERTGEMFDSCTIKVGDNEYIATRSEYFIKSLQTIINALADFEDDSDEPVLIRVKHLKSKRGNTFATCELA